MKKVVLGCLMALALVAGGNLKADSVGEKLALYLPNRIMDALDMFSVELGFGPTVRIELMATEYVKGGVGTGITARAVKSYNRQYGFALQSGWYWQLVAIGMEDTARDKATRWVTEFREDRMGVPDFDDNLYNMWEGGRDFWRIGGALGLLVEAEVYLHPVDIADFVLGFFLIDIKGDDYTVESFM